MNVKATIALSTIAAAALVAAGCKKENAPATADAAPPATLAKAAVEAPAAEAAEEAVEAPAAEAAEEADDAVVFEDSETLVSAYGKNLTYGEAISNIRRAMKMQGVPEEQLDQAAKQVAKTALPQIAEEFVMLNALRDAAAKAGVSSTDEDVDAEFTKMTSQLPPGLTLEEALERSGLSAEELKKQIAETLPVKKLFEIIAQGSEPTDEEIAKFYEEQSESFKNPEQVRASHILVKVDAGASDEDKAAAKAKIEGILAQIKEGADFAELAKANSDCPSKEEGGDLGFFGHGQMVPEFDAAAFALEEGGISDIVETQFGFHVIKKTGSKEAGVTPLEEVKDRIAEHLGNEKKGEIINGYIKNLRQKLVFDKNEKLAPIFANPEEGEGEEEKPAAESAPEEK